MDSWKAFERWESDRLNQPISLARWGHYGMPVLVFPTGGGDAGYELQVLDNYKNTTYVNGQVGSLYKQAVPLANACRKPGEWQTYDVVWMAPKFDDHGILRSMARATACAPSTKAWLNRPSAMPLWLVTTTRR